MRCSPLVALGFTVFQIIDFITIYGRADIVFIAYFTAIRYKTILETLAMLLINDRKIVVRHLYRSTQSVNEHSQILSQLGIGVECSLVGFLITGTLNAGNGIRIPIILISSPNTVRSGYRECCGR